MARSRGRHSRRRRNRFRGSLLALLCFCLIAGGTALIYVGIRASAVGTKPARKAASAAQPSPEASSTAASAVATVAPSDPVTPPAPDPALAAVTVPEKMADVPSGCQQLIVITGTKIGTRSGRLALFDRVDDQWLERMSTRAYFGDRGLVDGEKRKTGNLQTPTGIWRISDYLFGIHSTPPTGTLMPYRRITGTSYWSCSNDETYNTWVESKRDTPGEHLADTPIQYEYAFNSGYNSPPNERVYGRGTAIFIHCNEPPGNTLGMYTHGCVAIDRKQMKKLFTLIDPNRDPFCAIGTLEEGSATAIWSY